MSISGRSLNNYPFILMIIDNKIVDRLDAIKRTNLLSLSQIWYLDPSVPVVRSECSGDIEH